MAQIRIDGKVKNLGLYAIKEDAAKAYRDASAEFYRDFSHS